ncbi:MAG: hypothetical protein JWM27_1759 [Gemmatimonadetes bacterium]|nr:hypothetical protein [Gemmatimonadota bacterium]
MKLARLILASAALFTVAACSSDRITAPSRPAPPVQLRASLIRPDTGTVPVTLDGTPLQTCTTTTVVVNGVTSAVTTCDNGQLGSGQ